MMLITPILLVLTLLFISLTHAQPTTGTSTATAAYNVAPTPPYVDISLSGDDTCYEERTRISVSVSGGCVALPEGSTSLRVLGITGADKLTYKSLRVWHHANCTGGWSLEPAWDCYKHGCNCSHIVAYKGITLVKGWGRA